MKRAVEILQPVIQEQKKAAGKSGTSAGRILMATVKGDVHDIGKNIVCVVMACNNFDIVDLGVMVPTETIVQKAIEHKVDAIGLSGLITPSLDEMISVVKALEAAGLKVPVMIGGATTSEIHTAVKIAPCYSGVVAYVKDASQNAYVAQSLINNDVEFIQKLKARQQQLRDENDAKQSQKLTEDEVLALRTQLDWQKNLPPMPQYSTPIFLDNIDLRQLEPFINWRMYLLAWKVTGDFAGVEQVTAEADGKKWLESYEGDNREKAEVAVKTIVNAHKLLDLIIEQKRTTARAIVELVPANGDGNDIIIYTDEQRTQERHRFAMKRQLIKNSAGTCSALSDYIAPLGQPDHIGLFAATAGIGAHTYIEKLRAEGNDYEAIAVQLLCDRLVEALSEWLHYQVRTKYWGYVPDENCNPREILRGNYIGIRPAIGYPADPDHVHMRELFDLLSATEKTGIELSENYTMTPQSSVCGYYIAAEDAKYFNI